MEGEDDRLDEDNVLWREQVPELPEIAARAREMRFELVGKTITSVEVLQPKSLNLPPEEFRTALTGATLVDVSYHGKWLLVEMTQGWLLLNLGMGGELLLVTRDTLPAKYRLILDFDDHTCLVINFWWVGYVHYVAVGKLAEHRMTARLGLNALEVTSDDLRALLKGRRRRIKSLLLDQSQIAGIGNYYIHDILFLARLHPLRPANTLSETEIDALAQSIRDVLQVSLDKGGAWYEVDLHGERGGFTRDDLIVAYKEGQPCPACGAPVEKIKTGSTSHFLCPQCQAL